MANETKWPTLLDLAKASDPSGKIASIVEILNETNEMMLDMVWKEGNLITGHQTTIRSGLPAPTWRRLYQGVQPTKATNVQVTDSTGMLEAFSEVDKALADLNSNKAAFLLSEAAAHIEGMTQEQQETLLYGNEGTEVEAFTGFSPRFNDLSAANGANILDAGGSANLRSIWLIVWGDRSCHGIVPKGSTAGLEQTDLGEDVLENVDGAGGRMRIYRSHFRWDAGLTVRDWRYVVRIANIDQSLLTADASSGADLTDLMFDAMERVPNLAAGRAAFYMPRTIRQFVRKQLSNKVKQSTLEIRNVGGVMTQFYQEVPMRRVDKMAADELQVT